MAKTRMVNTRFWDDNYTSNLDPIEKLLFLYFLTNTSTNISGVYEIPLKKIANETGIDKEMVLKIIDRFSRENKIFYKNGWIAIKNFIKNQNQRSPKVKRGIEIELENAPEDIKNLLELEGIDTLSHSNTNSNTNSNINSNTKEKKSIDIELPEFIDPEVWRDWENHRKDIKKKLTPLTIKKQLKFLSENQKDYKEIINRSILMGWTGLFPIQKDSKNINVYQNKNKIDYADKIKTL